MQEKVAKMEQRRGKEERETHTISKTRKKSTINKGGYCYYYSLQKPYEFVAAVRRAVLRCLGFDKTQTPARGGGGAGGCGVGDPASTTDDPPTSNSATSVTVMRSYDASATLITRRKPPTPPVSSGRSPQIH